MLRLQTLVSDPPGGPVCFAPRLASLFPSSLRCSFLPDCLPRRCPQVIASLQRDRLNYEMVIMRQRKELRTLSMSMGSSSALGVAPSIGGGASGNAEGDESISLSALNTSSFLTSPSVLNSLTVSRVEDDYRRLILNTPPPVPGSKSPQHTPVAGSPGDAM